MWARAQAAQPAAARGPGAELRFQAGGATSSGPAAGLGYEIILQAFNWESHREKWYQVGAAPMHRASSSWMALDSGHLVRGQHGPHRALLACMGRCGALAHVWGTSGIGILFLFHTCFAASFSASRRKHARGDHVARWDFFWQAGGLTQAVHTREPRS